MSLHEDSSFESFSKDALSSYEHGYHTASVEGRALSLEEGAHTVEGFHTPDYVGSDMEDHLSDGHPGGSSKLMATGSTEVRSKPRQALSNLGARSDQSSPLDVAVDVRSDSESDESTIDSSMEFIYVDPIRDIDLAPVLICCCGCLPCCCCLYSGLERDSDDENSNASTHNPFPVNKNVLLMFILSAIHGIANSLWMGVVLSVFIYELTGRRYDYVGYVEAIFGICEAVFSIPLDYMGAFSLSGTIKFSGLLFLIAACITVWMVIEHTSVGPDNPDFDKFHTFDKNFILIVSVMAMWGIASSSINGPIQKIFRESLKPRSADQCYTILQWTNLLCHIIGPLIAITIFQIVGNTWKLHTLKTVMLIGIGLEMVVGCICFAFREKFRLKGNAAGSLTGSNETEELPRNVEENKASANEDSPKNVSSSNITAYFLFISGLLVSFGGAVVLKFFPLYLKNEKFQNPCQILALYSVIPLLMAFGTFFTFCLSTRLGSLETIILTKLLGVAALFAIANGWTEDGKGAVYIKLLFLSRVALVNSSRHVEERFYAANVNANERSRWRRLDFVVTFTRGAAPAVGGILITKYRFLKTFNIGGIIQTLGIFVLLLLWCRLSSEKPKIQDNPKPSNEKNEEIIFKEGDSGLQAPLLGDEHKE